MNVLNFNSEQCRQVRRQLDAYLSNELLVETTGEVLRHLESCASCARELEARTHVRDALRRAVAAQAAPEVVRQSIERRLRKMQPGFFGASRQLVWAAILVAITLGGIAASQWFRLQRGRRLVAQVLAIGVADHIQCAIQGHNYPNVANPPDQLRQKLGPEYAGLLAVVQQKLPGFEILEAHLCSVKGSTRQYIHFITRGRGTILSVILTRSDGARFPNGRVFPSGSTHGVELYEAHLQGMNAAGFESKDYVGFVVSDLSPAVTLQIASQLAPPLKAALDGVTRLSARWNREVKSALCRTTPDLILRSSHLLLPL